MEAKNHYCTLFDKFYLSRGLTMYESLRKTNTSFLLYIVTFDQISFDVLRRLNLDFVIPIDVTEMEDDKLLSVKVTRTPKEYCWTCTPFVIRYCLERFDLEACTYLDSDLYFFSDPIILLQEQGERGVLITDHHYSKRYDQSSTSGRYCVQFVNFRQLPSSMAVLNWWCDRCLEWCYDRFEDGKFGDQKYLDDWTSRFEGIHVLIHPGGGLAPWNVQRYSLKKEIMGFWVTLDGSETSYPLVFYHFHGVRFVGKDQIDLGSYDLRYPHVLDLYQEYLTTLISAEAKVKEILTFSTSNRGLNHGKLVNFGKGIIRRLLGVHNVYSISNLIMPATR